MGRVSGLKAREFARDLPEGDDSDLGLYGLDKPRALITLHFGNRDPLILRIGRPVSDAEDEELAYMIVEGDRTVYTARQALLEEYSQDPESLRLRRFMRMEGSDVVALKVWLAEGDEGDPAGEVHLRKGVSKWEWADGQPVPGSTPERVATRVAAVRAEEFVADAPRNLGAYGLDAPIARAIVATRDGTQRTLLIGGEGEPWMDPEERPMERYFAKVEEEPAVYLVDRGALSVLRDAVREHSRKQDRDEDKEERRDAMEKARSGEETE
jgi:hypothetical protein